MRTLSVALVVLCACGPSVSTTNPCANGGGASPTTLVTGRAMKNLAVTGEYLVYVDSQGRGTLRRANLDGSNDMELYAAPSPRRLFDSTVVGNTVWLFEIEEALSGIVTRVLRIPVEGGAATPIVVSEQTVFFLRHEASPERFFVRMANDGSERGAIYSMELDGTLTRILGPKILEAAQVTDDDVFFLTRPSLATDATARALHRAPKTADASSTQVGSVFCRGDFRRLTSGNILCSGYSSTGEGSPSSVQVTVVDANGGAARTLFDYSDTEGLRGFHALPSAEVGAETLFTFTGSVDAYPLLAVNTDTGATRALSCEVAAPRIGVGSGRPELIVSGDFVYWIGEGARGVPPDSIFRVPLR